MHFDVVGFIFNSLVLLFFTMTLGNLFGNVKFRKFNFGITGTLFIGLFVGYFLTKYAVTIPEESKYFSKAQNVLKGNVIDNSIMNLSLLIFIVGTGLLAAKDMKYAITKFGKQFVIIAIFIPFVGAVASYGFSQIFSKMSPYQITGTYTGALTSSAGLAAATESSEAVFLILGINFIPKIFRFDVEKEKEKYFAQKKIDLSKDKDAGKNTIPEVKMDFVGFSVAAFLGYFLGGIKISMGPLGTFSLGSIGGAIIVALLLGFIGKIGPITFRMDSVVLGKMRTYFLSIFLAGTGLNYGFRVVEAVTGDGIMIAVVSALVAILSVLFGFLLGHYVFHINWTLLSGAITGGMTSAPGLGAAIDALDCDEPAVSYGATQPLATLCMVIFSIIIHKLPI